MSNLGPALFPLSLQVTGEQLKLLTTTVDHFYLKCLPSLEGFCLFLSDVSLSKADYGNQFKTKMIHASNFMMF